MITSLNTTDKSLSPKTGRTEVVRVRLTMSEKEELTKRTADAGEKSVSEYLRKRAFNLVYTIPPINREACNELRKMTTHICQMTKFIEKATQAGLIPKQNFEIFQEFSKKLGEYHQDLRGKIASELRGEDCQKPTSIITEISSL